MPIFMIAYDLRGKRKVYEGFYDTLKVLDSRSPLKAVQFVETDRDAASLFMDLSEGLEPEDRIVVMEIKDGADWFAYGISNERWLKAKLPQS
ncbi:hypothetical protein C7I84_22340 [Mesorhizobium ephedrae]|uniref:Uncharacterized protein n=2 Tax=Kumtagia ephedrae TaxID=2116701 RepID=A0A2P7S081_9HYPH|nr:hypothetical protein C7I84_22340 [Mesorhizobium ephedrae]